MSFIMYVFTEEKPLIKVKDFARANFIENNDSKNDTKDNEKAAQIIETILVSSDDEEANVKPKPAPKTPRKRKQRLPPIPSSANRNRNRPLNFKNHKISEYFPATKRERKYIW